MKLTVNNELMSFIVPRKATDSNSRTISLFALQDCSQVFSRNVWMV